MHSPQGRALTSQVCLMKQAFVLPELSLKEGLMVLVLGSVLVILMKLLLLQVLMMGSVAAQPVFALCSQSLGWSKGQWASV